MSIWTIAAKVIGLIPAAVEAGRAIAEAFNTPGEPNEQDSLLWHTVTYGRGLMRCVTCGMYVEKQNVLCPEAVRRRKNAR